MNFTPNEVRAWLRKNKRSQAWLADQVGVSTATVNRWLMGHWQPTKSRLILLNKIMNNGSIYEPFDTNDKNMNKDEKIRDLIYGGGVPLPAVATLAKLPLRTVECYLADGTGGEKVADAILEAANSYQKSKYIAKQPVKKGGILEYEAELAGCEYLKEEVNSPAIIVRFTQREWEKVQALFPADCDIELCLRTYLLNCLAEFDDKVSVNPRKVDGYEDKRKDALFHWTYDGLSVAVNCDADVRKLFEVAAKRHGFSLEKLLHELYVKLPGDVVNGVDAYDEEEDTVFGWKERALRAEEKLRRVARIAKMEE